MILSSISSLLVPVMNKLSLCALELDYRAQLRSLSTRGMRLLLLMSFSLRVSYSCSVVYFFDLKACPSILQASFCAGLDGVC